jgi:hypothetical protein
MINKHRIVSLALSKANTKKERTKTLKPCPGGLLKAINGLMKFTHMIGSVRVSKVRWLPHIYIFG